MHRRYLLLSCVALTAVACGGSSSSDVDAAPLVVDALVVTPDAPRPDARVLDAAQLPDGQDLPPHFDAMVIDTPPIVPDASVPDAAQVPDGQDIPPHFDAMVIDTPPPPPPIDAPPPLPDATPPPPSPDATPTCPALGGDAGDGCDQPQQLTCGSGDVLTCSTVGMCGVWTVTSDCASLALSCNNNQCVCPPNTSHNFYVGPNYDRAAAPANLSPNGLLTANGLCTFPAIGPALNVAGADVLLNQPAMTYVVAVALPGRTATFSNEVFPLIVGNRTTLTTYEDPDPRVGGHGLDPDDYFISFNSASANHDNTAVIVNPITVSAFGDAPVTTAPAGGAAGFRGFSVQATQANQDCPDPLDPPSTDPRCGPTVGGALFSIFSFGGEQHLASLHLMGHASDAPTVRDDDPDAPLHFPMQIGIIMSDFPSTGPWGTYDDIVVDNFGVFDPDHRTPYFFDDEHPEYTFGFGVLPETTNQGAGHRAVFSHFTARDCDFAWLQFGGAITMLDDPSLAKPNLITNTTYTTPAGTIGTTAFSSLSLEDGGTALIDFDAHGLFVENGGGSGIGVEFSYVAASTPGGPIDTASVARFTGGAVTGSRNGTRSSIKVPNGTVFSGEVNSADGVAISGAGAIVDPSGDDTTSTGILTDPSGDDTTIGGVFIDGMTVDGNDGNGVEIGNGFAVPPAPTDGAHPATLVQLTNVTIANNGALADDVSVDNDGDDLDDTFPPLYGHDGLLVEDVLGDPTVPVRVTVTRSHFAANGVLGDNGAQLLAAEGRKATAGPVNSFGDGVAIYGGDVTIATTSITDNVLSGVHAADSAGGVHGRVVLDDVGVAQNTKDTCASHPGHSCRGGGDFPSGNTVVAAGVLVENSGGFHAMNSTEITDNGGPGVYNRAHATGAHTCGRAGTDACPLQIFDATVIDANGSGTPRDDGFGAVYPPTNQGFYNAPGANAALGDDTQIFDNSGPGVETTDGAEVYLGDVLIDNNGANGGAFASDAFDPADTVPAARSGVQIDLSGNVVATGTATKALVISDNAAGGIDLVGTLDARDLRVTGNHGPGILVHASADLNGLTSVVANSELDHNAGDGLTILATESDFADAAAGDTVPTCKPGFTLAGDRPTLRSLTSIHDNAGNGATIGALDATQTGVICARLGDADIHDNAGVGIVTAQPDVDLAASFTAETSVYILDDDVYSNGMNGLLVHPSAVGEVAGVASPTFAQNKFHSNGLNQVVFDGGGDDIAYFIDSQSGQCDSGANAMYCYSAKQLYGIFAQGESRVTVAHVELEGGGSGLRDYGAQAGSTISVSETCTAITTCP